MGTGGRRYGAGRPGWRAKCEHHCGFDIRKLHSLEPGARGSYCWTCDGEDSGVTRYTICPTSVTLVYAWSRPDVEPVNRRLDVHIERTPCHFGGSRPWFRCPICRRRCAIVYGMTHNGGFACRLCMDLAYASEGEDPLSRGRRKIWKLEDRLDAHGGRPMGMHWRTYVRIRKRLMEAEAKLTTGTLRLIASLGRRKW